MKSKLKTGLLMVLGVFIGLLVLVAIMDHTPSPDPRPDRDRRPASPASQPIRAAEPSPVDPAKDIAARMTNISPTFHVPWPDDAKPMPNEKQGVTSRIATVSEITAFYREWMTGHGWTFEQKYSTMDPDQGVLKSLGYTTSQIWCKRTSPITTVSIIVGSGDQRDHGKHAEIIILELPDENSCP